MREVQIISDVDLTNIDGAGWKASGTIAVLIMLSPIITPLPAIGAIIGYYGS